MKYILVCLFAAVTSQAAKVACFNKSDFGTTPLTIEVNGAGTESVLTYKGQTCKIGKISYKPQSAQYFGYVRFSPAKDECEKLSAALFGLDDYKKPIALHWISVSPEAFAGKQGPVQIGFENILDPGAGGTAKTLVGCFPARY